ncbi:MAG: MMPL family transporter [Gammaproteobacteria bacterium]|nr:MMPL family transporter [Gammaproteobacteria bacterium]
MHTDHFFNIGKFINKIRWGIIVVSLLLFFASLSLAPKLMEPFKSIGFTDPYSQSARTNEMLNDKLGYSYNRFMVMYHSDSLLLDDPSVQEKIKTSLADLIDFPIPHKIIYPEKSNKQISKDKHTAYAVILFKSNQEVDSQTLKQLKDKIKKPAALEMHIGGEPIFLEDTKTQTQLDLYKAEYIATPVAIIIMLAIFGSVIAASLPVLLGGVCALFILVALYGLGHIFTLSVFTINIALLLGLCLSLDYAILIINRYREELLHDRSKKTAIAITIMTAGKSVFFSGLAVFISLSALLLFPINILFSVGIGGLAAVTVSVLVAIVLLPAVLAVLGTRINRFSLYKIKSETSLSHAYWHWLVTKVVNAPKFFFITILLLLLILGYPFLQANFGISDFRILPKTNESRQVFEMFKSEFGESRLAPILVIIKSPEKNILNKKNISAIYDFTNELAKNKSVDQITSIVNTDPKLTKAQYQMLYSSPKKYWSRDLKKLLDITTHDDLTVISVVGKYDSNSKQTYHLIKQLRHTVLPNNLQLEVTGTAVNTIDVLKSISTIFPYAFLWIVAFTYIILLLLLRSVVLPLKAIITTILSLCASYGVLVLVIQMGYLHKILNFEPQGMLDISLLIIIFSALFGISMDYEVFLLTRIKEFFEKTNDNEKSIILGIERSSKIISSAAIIIIFLCFSFMSADILMVKAFGLGIAVAVFVDAFIIRTLLVPATMKLLNTWNWYLPKFLKKILPKISFNPEGG